MKKIESKNSRDTVPLTLSYQSSQARNYYRAEYVRYYLIWCRLRDEICIVLRCWAYRTIFILHRVSKSGYLLQDRKDFPHMYMNRKTSFDSFSTNFSTYAFFMNLLNCVFYRRMSTTKHRSNI
jgi:hypothetical protein